MLWVQYPTPRLRWTTASTSVPWISTATGSTGIWDPSVSSPRIQTLDLTVEWITIRTAVDC